MPWKTIHRKDQRWKFLQEVLRKKTSVRELCKQWDISPKTAYKWMARFRERGRFGLADGLHVAHRITNRPSDLWLARIRRWRARHPHWGAPKLRWALQQRFGKGQLPSESAIGRWLKEWGLTGKRSRPTHKGPVVQRPHLTQAKEPNDVWTVDFKGWFRTGDQTRVEPLTVRDLASRYVLAIELMGRQNIQACRKVFERIFARYGLPRVIRSDNGSPFGATGALGLTRLSAWWVKLGIRMEFIAPGRPDQNGAHEQFHRVYKQETLQPPTHSLKGQKRRSEQWRQQYNRERPHEGLHMAVPVQFYRKSHRALPGKLRPWRYPAEWKSRLVKSKGTIQFQGRGRFVGQAFDDQQVGLKRSGPGVWEVYFGPHLMGELWDAETTGIRAVWFAKGRPRK